MIIDKGRVEPIGPAQLIIKLFFQVFVIKKPGLAVRLCFSFESRDSQGEVDQIKSGIRNKVESERVVNPNK